MAGAAGIAAVAMAFACVLALPRVPVIQRNHPVAAVGDDVEVILLSPSAFPPSGMLRWAVVDQVRTPAEGTRGYSVRVLPGAVGYRIAAHRRGCHLFGPPRACWQDPLGLLRVEHAYRGDDATVSVWVRPWADGSVTSVTTRAMADEEKAPAAGNPVLGGTAFHGLRDYEPGDDVRLIDWRATARRAGQLTVRQYAAPDLVPAQLGHVIVLDTDAGSYPDHAAGDAAFENAVEIAASLCSAGVREGQLTVLATTSEPAETASRGQPSAQHARDAMMDRLARAMRSRAGVSPWMWAVRPRAGMPEQVGALTVVTGPGGQDMPATLIADTQLIPVVTLVRTGEKAGAAQPYLARIAASNAITRISVADSKRFAPAWNQIRLR